MISSFLVLLLLVVEFLVSELDSFLSVGVLDPDDLIIELACAYLSLNKTR